MPANYTKPEKWQRMREAAAKQFLYLKRRIKERKQQGRNIEGFEAALLAVKASLKKYDSLLVAARASEQPKD